MFSPCEIITNHIDKRKLLLLFRLNSSNVMHCFKSNKVHGDDVLLSINLLEQRSLSSNHCSQSFHNNLRLNINIVQTNHGHFLNFIIKYQTQIVNLSAFGCKRVFIVVNICVYITK